MIQLCVALAPETTGIDRRQAARVNAAGTLLINTARGQLVEIAAIEAALDTGQLGGYATDVWHPEPPPSERHCSVIRECS